MPTIRTDDNVDIYYEELGSGDKIVLCTQCGHEGTTLERELAKRGFHVYLLTNRGFGRSTHVTEDYGEHWYDMFAKDVIAFADQMGIDRFIYSGASHGAGAGWHVCLNYPERVIHKHCWEVKRSICSLKREGFRFIYVIDSMEQLENVEVVRTKLWNTA